MRTVALLLCVVLALPAYADDAPQTSQPPTVVKKERGFLSGLGLGLLIGGFAGVSVGVGGLVGAIETQTYLSAYGPNPSDAERPSVTALEQRLGGNSALAVIGLVGGGLAVAGGILCLALDTPGTSIAFLPTTQGGVFVFNARF